MRRLSILLFALLWSVAFGSTPMSRSGAKPILSSMPNPGDLTFFASFASSTTPEIASGSGTTTFGNSTSGNSYINNSGGMSKTGSANAPRFDWMSGISGFLIEPSATNNNLWSESIDVATSGVVYGRVKSGVGVSPAITADYAVAPDGMTTADRIVMDATGWTTTSDYSRIYQSFSVTNGAIYSYSIWVKSNTATTYSIIFRDDGAGMFNTIRSVAPNWQRFTFTGKAGSTSAACGLWVRPAAGTSPYADLSVWGGQFEAGAPTAYVKTTTTSSATGADKLSYAASSNISYSAGTISVWFYPEWSGSDGIAHYFLFCGGTASQNAIALYKDTDNALHARLYGATDGSYRGLAASIPQLTAYQWHNVIASWDATGIKSLALDGAKVGYADNSGSWTNATALGSTIYVCSNGSQALQAEADVAGFAIWGKTFTNLTKLSFLRVN